MKMFVSALMCLVFAASLSFAQGAKKEMKEAKQDMKEAKKDMKEAKKEMKEAKKEGDKADMKEAKKDMKEAKSDMKDAKDKVVGKTADGKEIYEGPRGGRYTLSASGKKQYIKDK
ncbi:MAG: hypothetical protein JNL32_01005 [Candidatus Kapabacteria bacterium]|nr:hypothetical protein [Candidatus Kapabacteria bacterium]